MSEMGGSSLRGGSIFVIALRSIRRAIPRLTMYECLEGARATPREFPRGPLITPCQPILAGLCSLAVMGPKRCAPKVTCMVRHQPYKYLLLHHTKRSWRGIKKGWRQISELGQCRKARHRRKNTPRCSRDPRPASQALSVRQWLRSR